MAARSVIPIVLGCVVFAMPALLFAHGSGASYEKTIGAYTIDIGYDPVTPRAGDRLIFDFGLVQQPASTTVDFDYVWVRLQGAEGTFLATGINKPDFGPTSLVYLVPQDFEGELTVNARYQKGENTLVEDSFPLTIQKRDAGIQEYLVYIVGVISVLSGAAVGFMMNRIFRRRE